MDNDDVISTLNDLIETCKDGEYGYRASAEHLRNAPTRLMKQLGHGQGYRYAHDEAGGFSAGETYLPDGMARPGWYDPTDRGFESRIRDRLAELRARDREGGA